uniref:NAD(P)H-quinone oxidoreductase subunit 5, chloroplastic n=1 Tax=Nitella hyalina TaxID=181804 RepID=A0A2H4G3H7_NITHY|nr:NADH dehydrogenase subunit 5 [Nitella hyalina]
MDFIFNYQYTWLIPLLPFLSALLAGIGLISFTRSTRSLRYYYALVSIVMVVFSMLLSLSLLWKYVTGNTDYCFLISWIINTNISLKIGFFIDPLSSLMLFLVTSVAILVMCYSHGYMLYDQSYVRFFAYLSLFTASMLGLILSPNLFQIYIFWELVGTCSYLLIGFWFTRPSAADACQKAFITNRIGDFCLLLGILGFYWITNSFDFSLITARTKDIIYEDNFSFYFLTCSSILIFCGPIAKSAQFPLHIWLPDAMEGPTPISALIHAATMVAAGIFLVARLFPLFQIFSIVMKLIAWIGVITAFLGASIALSQIDLKKSLAYSTISQLGYMMLAMGIGSYKASLFHLVTHAYSKALLFLGSGSVIHSLENVLGYNPENTQNLILMGGLRKSMPITRLTFLIGTLSLSGIPPFACFWSKDEILADTWNNDPVLAWIAWITAGLTSFYMFRIYLLTFEGDFRGTIFFKEKLFTTIKTKESDLSMLISLVILAFATILIGFISTPFCDFLNKYLNCAITDQKDTGYYHFFIVSFSSIGIAVIGILIAFLSYFNILKKNKIYNIFCYKNKRFFQELYFNFYKLSFSKWHIESIYTFFFIEGTRNLSQIIFCLDQWFIDGIVNFIGISTLLSSQSLKNQESGRISSYLFAILIGTIFLLFILPLKNSLVNFQYL